MIDKIYPKLYGLSKSGKVKEWLIFVKETKGKAFVITQHGYSDGKKVMETLIIESGKNIGRANETSVLEQAKSEAKSKWNKQKDKGYSESIKSIPTNILPMLAKRYDECGDKIEFPCYVQPKLDGVRCLTKRINGKIEFYSRNGKKYETLNHIEAELKEIMVKDEIFDGEIYAHKQRFQDIISAVKNIKNKDKATLDNTKLKYYIFDYADTSISYEKRYEILKNKFKGKNFKYLVLVDTVLISGKTEVKDWHGRLVKLGYEGVILRNKKGLYEFSHRSDDLQKYKTFVDEEFKVIGVRSGKGRYIGCGTFICQTKDNRIFEVNPMGSLEQKKEYLTNKSKYVGKMLIVKFQEKSKDDIPRFPVGIAIRDYE